MNLVLLLLLLFSLVNVPCEILENKRAFINNHLKTVKTAKHESTLIELL